MAKKNPVLTLHDRAGAPLRRRPEEQATEALNRLQVTRRVLVTPLVDDPDRYKVQSSYEQGDNEAITATSLTALSGTTAVTVTPPSGVELVIRVTLTASYDLDDVTKTMTLAISDGTTNQAQVAFGAGAVATKYGCHTEYVVSTANALTFTPKAMVGASATANIYGPILTVTAIPQTNRFQAIPRTFTFPLHVSEGNREVLVSGALLVRPSWSSSSTAHYRVKLGVARGQYTEWVGEIRTDQNRIAECERISLTGTSDLNRLLRDNDVLVVQVETTNDPGSLAGSAVEVVLDKSGGA